MFKLQNQQYEFDDTYTFCVQEKFTELKPFGQTPTTLKRNIKQAFDAARTFVQGLAVGRNVATKMASVRADCSLISIFCDPGIVEKFSGKALDSKPWEPG